MPSRGVEFTLLKLGGSLITHKEVPDSINRTALNLVASAIRKSKLPSKEKGLILVHGGGSFGHYYARNAGLSRTPRRISPLGIAMTNNAMQRLNSLVVGSLLSHQVPTETILPSELVARGRRALSPAGRDRVLDSLGCGLVPISLGYVILDDQIASVISGDEICFAIANSLNVKRMIFAMDVDGIYADSSLKGGIIRSLTREYAVGTKSRRYDVTGGIGSKLELGFKLFSKGIQVFYVNGTRPKRLMNLLAGKEEPRATMISN